MLFIIYTEFVMKGGVVFVGLSFDNGGLIGVRFLSREVLRF